MSTKAICGLVSARGGHGRGAVAGLGDLVAGELQREAHHLARVRLIFDQQYAAAGRDRSKCRRGRCGPRRRSHSSRPELKLGPTCVGYGPS
jgi:hypothetical protein